MSKYIKLDDAISKIVNTPTRVITGDLTALADRQHEIIDMLSDLPTIEVSEDCISKAELRKSLARPLENNNTDEMYWKGWHDCTVAVETRIADAPSVVPSREEGEWIINEPIESGFGTIFECPYCKYEVEFEPTNYCPNCGAKMRLE